MCFTYAPSCRALRRSSPVAAIIVAAESRRGPSPLRGPGDNKLCKGLQGSSGAPEPRDGEGVRVPGLAIKAKDSNKHIWLRGDPSLVVIG